MSEVIEDFIRRHPGASEGEAFEDFLGQPRIRAWVGDDASRRDRLHREFTRVWSTMRGGAAASTASPAAARVVQQPPPVREPVAREPAVREPVREPVAREPTAREPAAREPAREAPRPHAPQQARAPVRTNAAAAGRKLQLMCPSCARIDVWLEGGTISCRTCGTVYDDMLALVPVKPVGPFEYLFGEGTKGALTAVGVGLLLLGVYGVLKWL